MRKKTVIGGLGHDELTQRLNKLKISSDRYEKEYGQLIKKGYLITEAQSIILRISSKRTVETLLMLHDFFIDKKKFTHKQLVSIAIQNGGSLTLRAIEAKIGPLMTLGYDIAQIIKVASTGGGTSNLDSLLEKTSDLVDFGFKPNHIWRIAAYNGGSNNINAVCRRAPDLLKYGLTPSEIQQIASQHGGSRRIELVHKYFLSLPLTKEEILNYIKRPKGDGVLEELGQEAQKYQENGLLIPKNIVKAILTSQNAPKKAKKRSLEVSQSSSVAERDAAEEPPYDGENLAAAGAPSPVIRRFAHFSQTFWSEQSSSTEPAEQEEESDPSIFHHKMKEF